MRRAFSFIAITLFTAAMSAFPQAAISQTVNPLVGVWANGSRFVEFAPDGRMRMVLKTYYAFVYEDRDWMPYTIKPLAGVAQGDGSAQDSNVAAQSPSGNLDPASPVSNATFVLTLQYPKEKHGADIPLAVIGDAIYFRFYRKMELPASAGNATSSGSTTGNVSATGEPANGAGNAVPSATSPLDGFWIAAGNTDALRLYRSDPIQEFFCYYFRGSDYYRIRYWATDARPKAVQASFTGRNGEPLAVPKFIPIAGTLYTCVTSTGKVLRNYESGTFTGASGALTFKPSAIVFAGTAAAVREPLKYALSADGTALALGEPYLARSKVADLSAEIKAHNALRRPPRKPIFGFMKLDFHWDEIEKIRNNGVAPTEGK
ncbi:MAG TPA: hypothetical protein PK542_01045 [Treponemataceae bacterium]|nr:hypothetical protein [Treponemataceae bacterium]